jgi:hypothetical protein
VTDRGDRDRDDRVESQPHAWRRENRDWIQPE